MELSKELSYLNDIKINQVEIASQILPEVQYLVLEQIRPTEEQLQIWRCSVGGRQLFGQYLSSFFNYNLSRQFQNFAWDYYNLNTSKIRNPELRKKFLRMQGNNMKCLHCATQEGKFEVDHKIPLSRGGKDEINNLQILCKNCNRKKSNRFDFKLNVLVM
ncbi:HNH endonuclease [Niallia taxi]|uniref:HNH endonuclease n=1 Tax=Niallia taxi TaxID=2499688 RepID=UPI002E1C17A1|nr:HNH endonuclease [Niallia taxi]